MQQQMQPSMVQQQSQPQVQPQPQAQPQPQPQVQQQLSSSDQNKIILTPPQDNSVSFVADEKSKELIRMMHPEMANAALNIALKKFAETTDFFNYFVKEEFKDIVEELVKEEESAKPGAESKSTKQTSNSSGVVDFTSW